MLTHTASLSAAFVVGDQKVAILLYPEFEIVQATFWNTNNGGKKNAISEEIAFLFCKLLNDYHLIYSNIITGC